MREGGRHWDKESDIEGGRERGRERDTERGRETLGQRE